MVGQVAQIKPKRLGLVWLYCPYPVLARGLIDILDPDARVHYGESAPSSERPDIVLFCAGGAEDVGEGVRRLQAQAPEAAIVVFGLSSDLSIARAGLQAGAKGFVHAGMEPSQVVRALTVAASGEVAVPRDLLRDLVAGREPVDLSGLTHRQQEILKLVAEGQTNAQIGRRLFLSESTVKQHLRAAYKVLKVRNRTEAAKLIRERANWD